MLEMCQYLCCYKTIFTLCYSSKRTGRRSSEIRIWNFNYRLLNFAEEKIGCCLEIIFIFCYASKGAGRQSSRIWIWNFNYKLSKFTKKEDWMLLQNNIYFLLFFELEDDLPEFEFGTLISGCQTLEKRRWEENMEHDMDISPQ